MNSPIDINFPVLSNPLKINIDIKQRARGIDIKRTENMLLLYSDFGTIKYLESNYEINQIFFVSPSEHTEGGQRSAVEMRLIGEAKGQ